MPSTFRSRGTDEFWELYHELPSHIKAAAREAYAKFERNPGHPALRFKPITNHPGLCSVRINKQYRVLGLMGDPIDWFWIGTHAEYDKLIA